MGDNFVKYKGAWVYKNHPHMAEEIDENNARKTLKSGGLFLRNIYNFDNTTNRSFWYVIKDSYGGLEELPSKVRNQVRRSLNTYDFKRVSKTEMQEIGLALFNKSRERFNDKSLFVTQEAWNDSLNQENLEFWLGYNKKEDTPAVFAINTVYDEYCDYNTMGISPDVPNNTYPIYGLLFEMNRFYLEERRLKYVLDGARSLTEHSNIQPFLEDKFNFRKAYCDLQLFYKPWLGFAIKLAFPFRKWINNRKAAALLRQEAWARGLEK